MFFYLSIKLILYNVLLMIENDNTNINKPVEWDAEPIFQTN